MFLFEIEIKIGLEIKPPLFPQGGFLLSLAINKPFIMKLKTFLRSASLFFFNLSLLLLVAKFFGATSITCTWGFLVTCMVLVFFFFILYMVNWDIVSENAGKGFYFSKVKREHKKALNKWREDEVKDMVRPLK